MRRDRSAGLNDVRNIRFTVLRQRSRHADNHRLDFLDPAKISRSGKLAGTHQFRDRRWFDVLDIALSVIQQVNLFGIDINAQDRHARASKLDRERQSDVTKSYDGDFHWSW